MFRNAKRLRWLGVGASAGALWATGVGFHTRGLAQNFESAVLAEGAPWEESDLPLTGQFPEQPLVDHDVPAEDAGEPLADTVVVTDECDVCAQGTCECGARSPCPPTPYGMFNRLIDRKNNKGACWTGRADLLLMWRNAPPPAALISAYDPGTGAIGGTVLDASQLESALAAGPRFTLMRTNACGHGFETTYFRAFNFRSQEELPIVVDGYALTPPGAFGNNFTNLSGAAANLGSGIQSFELNGRRQVFKNLALLGGFRWVEWRESLSLLDAAVDPGTGDIGFDNYSTDCMNSLYGGQIGFDTRLVQLGSWLRVDSWMKGGAYYNNAVQTSVYTTGIVGGAAEPPIQASAQVNAAAFVGEIGMMGTIPITRNLDFQFGYLGLWLESLAQPTNQLFGQTLVANQAPAGSITTTGGTVVQGLTLGLQGRW